MSNKNQSLIAISGERDRIKQENEKRKEEENKLRAQNQRLIEEMGRVKQ